MNKREFLKLCLTAPFAMQISAEPDPEKWQKIVSHPDFPLMSYEYWLETEWDELTIAWAENGYDREPDADWDQFVERKYANYCRAYDTGIKMLQRTGYLK